jgi:hypothetical protein
LKKKLETRCVVLPDCELNQPPNLKWFRGATPEREPHTMARQKRKSAAVDFAESRANALNSIDPALDLGNGLTLADYKTKTAALKAKNNKYNSDLSDLDERGITRPRAVSPKASGVRCVTGIR